MVKADAHIQQQPRHFLPENFIVTTWEILQPYFDNLKNRIINNPEELKQWLQDMSELEAVISEDASWRQIKMTCDTTDKKLEEAFAYFCMQIQPHLQAYADILNKKLLACPYISVLHEEAYHIYFRSVKNAVDLFREENISLQSELSVMQQQYGQIAAAMTVTVREQEYTLQQASKFLEQPDRALRQEVFGKMAARRMQDQEKLHNLYTALIQKRHQVALNAGFENYRDYKFRELGRFDYTKEDCFAFHVAIQQHMLPLMENILESQRQRLKLDILKPWDTEAEPEGSQPLHPFDKGEELIQKTIICFSKLHPFFGECLEVMQQMQRLDLDSRRGKAPGGYNCPLAETGVPFIFMNATGQMKDVTTMVHEGGHAVHSFLSHHLSLNAFKEYPMELAELASMSMELFTMDYWEVFFEKQEDLRKAKRQQLERVISIFPWIATIDAFQHWVYENPKHTIDERTRNWLDILNRFSTNKVDWTGWESYRAVSWQRQLHLFEVPFYYIEYGIAQLGAIAMWKQFKDNKKQALNNYMQALSLGYTKPLKELYKTAGIQFDLSPSYVKTLADFVKAELDKVTD